MARMTGQLCISSIFVHMPLSSTCVCYYLLVYLFTLLGPKVVEADCLREHCGIEVEHQTVMAIERSWVRSPPTALCFDLDKDTLTPHSTGLYPGSWASIPTRIDWKIVDWDVKPKYKHSKTVGYSSVHDKVACHADAWLHDKQFVTDNDVQCILFSKMPS